MPRAKFLFLVFLSFPATPVHAAETGERDEEAIFRTCERETCETSDHLPYCYSVKYGKGIASGYPGVNDHGPTFKLPHGSVFGVSPSYIIEPEVEEKDFIHDKAETGCNVSVLESPYHGTKISCPQKKETSWVFPFPQNRYNIYAWLDNADKRDIPSVEAIIASLVVLDEAECDARLKAYIEEESARPDD